MIEVPIPVLLLLVPVLAGVFVAMLLVVAHHYHARGRREMLEQLAPTWRPPLVHPTRDPVEGSRARGSVRFAPRRL